MTRSSPTPALTKSAASRQPSAPQPTTVARARPMAAWPWRPMPSNSACREYLGATGAAATSSGAGGIKGRSAASARDGAWRPAVDDAVAQHDDAVEVPLDLGIVRHHDDCNAFAVKPREQVHDLDRRVAVERAGGLVGEDEGRLVDERPGDGDALLLAARELAGQMPGALRKADLSSTRAARSRFSAPGMRFTASGNATFSRAVR